MNNIPLLTLCVCSLGVSNGYPYAMATLSYKALFEMSDLVVIAKPIKTVPSDYDGRRATKQFTETGIDPRAEVMQTEFEVLQVVKGEHKGKQLTFINLQTKTRKPLSRAFGALGMFFFDLDTTEAGKSAYMLFLSKEEKGRYLPVWVLSEWGRCVIRLPGESSL